MSALTTPAPLISFIVATRNSQPRLHGLLDSVRANCPPHRYEVLIADCASTDNTVDLIHSYSLILPIRIVSFSDSGIYNAWNKAIRHAAGTWLIFLGDDDSIYNTEEASSCFEFLSLLDPIAHPFVFFDAYLLPPASFFVKPSYSSSLLWKGMKFFHPSSAISRMVFYEHKFDENLRVASDYKFFSMLMLEGLHYPRIFTSIGQGGISHTSLPTLFKEILFINLSFYSNLLHVLYYPSMLLIYMSLRYTKVSFLYAVEKLSFLRYYIARRI